jgi:predicted transcriptional regulator
MLEDVSLPIIKFWDQKTSKDIKRNPATMTFRKIILQKMQAEKKCQTLERYRPNIGTLGCSKKHVLYSTLPQ